MAVKLKDSFAAELTGWVKRAMKGRPLYFGLQAQAAKKGKFLVSKKPGDVKPAKVKALELYEGDGKDQKKAQEKNTVTGAATCGVCQGESGTLKLYFEQGEAPPAAEKFVRHFIAREMKFKAVKRVKIVNAEPPEVHEHDSHDKPASKEELDGSYGELVKKVTGLKGAGPVQKQLLDLLNSARRHIDGGSLDEADIDLLGVRATLDLVQQLNNATRRLVALRDELKLAKRVGKLSNAQHEMEALVGEAQRKLTAAAKALAATDEDVAAAAADDLQEAEGLLKEAEELRSEGPVHVEQDAKFADFFGDWLERIKPELAELKDAQAPQFEAIASYVKDVASASKAKDWPRAAKSFKQANALIAEARAGLSRDDDNKRDRTTEIESGLQRGKGRWLEKYESLIEREEREQSQLDPIAMAFLGGPDKKLTDAPLGWGDGTTLPGAPRLDGLKTTLPEKFREGEAVIDLIENDEGRRMIAKIDRSGSFGHGAEELTVYQHIYETAGHHPNLARVHGLGVVQHGVGKMPALIMDEVVGDPGDKSMQKLSQAWKQGKISTQEFWGAIQFLGRRLLEVVRHLQEAGISHNDIKPSNFVVDETTGEPVLIDLGLHSVLGARAPGGTEGYTAPRVMNRGETTTTTDVYSIGRTLQRGLGGLVGDDNSLSTEVVKCLEALTAGLAGELTPEQAAGLDFLQDNGLDEELARKTLARVVSDNAPLPRAREITVSNAEARRLSDEWTRSVSQLETPNVLLGARGRARLDWLQRAESLLTRAKEEGVDGPAWTSLRTKVDVCLREMERAAREHQKPTKPVKWTPDWTPPINNFTLEQMSASVQQVIDAANDLLAGPPHVSTLHEVLSLHERADVQIRSLQAYINVLAPPRLPKDSELKQRRKKGKPVPSTEDLDFLANAQAKFNEQLALLEPVVGALADRGARLGIMLANAPAELAPLLEVDWYESVSAADREFHEHNPVVFNTLDDAKTLRVQEFLEAARVAWQVIGPVETELKAWLATAVEQSRKLGRGFLPSPDLTRQRDELYARISDVARALSIERDWIQRPGGQPPPQPDIGLEQRLGTDVAVGLQDLRTRIEAASVEQDLSLQERARKLEWLGKVLERYAKVKDPEAARLYKSTRNLYDRCLERVQQRQAAALSGVKKLLAETTPDHVWRTLNSIRVHLEHPTGLHSPNVRWFRTELEALARIASQVRQFQALVGDALDDKERKQLLKILEAMEGYDELEHRFELDDRSKPAILENTEQRSELSKEMDVLMNDLQQAASAPWPQETPAGKVQKRLAAVQAFKEPIEQLADPVRGSGITVDIEQFELLERVRDQMERALKDRL